VWNEDVTVRIFSPFAGRVVSVLVDAGQSVRSVASHIGCLLAQGTATIVIPVSESAIAERLP
jgi:hypothetical protein